MKTKSPAETVDVAARKTHGSPLVSKILVPVDFSEAGRPALRYAKSLAQLTGATVFFVHVLEPIYGAGQAYAGGEFSYVQLDSSQMREEIRRRIATLQTGMFRGIRTDFEIRFGTTFHEIVEAARAISADLTVITTHGYTGLKHVVLGSTAERVVRHAQCPVLVVRSRPKRKSTPHPKRKS